MGFRPGGASSRAECCPPPQRCRDCLQLLGGQHICTRKASSLKALSRRSQEAAGSLKFRIHDPFALPEPCSGCKDSAATCGTPRNPLFAWTSSASTSVPLLQDLPLSRAHPCRLAKTWRGREGAALCHSVMLLRWGIWKNLSDLYRLETCTPMAAQKPGLQGISARFPMHLCSCTSTRQSGA